MSEKKDQIFARALDAVSPFRFDEQVAQVFPDMINRSVPGYGLMLEMISVITRTYARPNTVLYDLGCSLGASTLAMRHALTSPNYHIFGIDNSEPMIERCQAILNRDRHPVPVTLECCDIESVQFKPTSVATMNFTLQFIPPDRRGPLLAAIARSMVPGGALILSEKLRFDQPAEETTLSELHLDFKRSRGYSEMEIAQKRASLERVLIPETFHAHRERLRESGFSSVTLWFQCFNFCSILAIK
ncbi:MAG: carboxy-S-adenosyl-L-methionine synthase CmoA [Hahellaceae bacterium]|nr:carboxy-S-adenosyl-L-methionine synthase CmoA [Hahellaceae bacterium]